MSDAEDRFIADRDVRNAARGLFDTRLAQVKGDLAERGIGGRVADQAKAEALAMAKETLAVARESKGIIAATAGAVLVWAFRKPIIAAIEARFSSDAAADEELEQEEPGSD